MCVCVCVGVGFSCTVSEANSIGPNPSQLMYLGAWVRDPSSNERQAVMYLGGLGGTPQVHLLLGVLRKGTTNSHTGNSTSTSLCTTSSPSLSSVCRRGGEGEGALWFPVLWVILPHPAPVVPGLVVPCAPAPPRWPKARGLAWGGSYADDV